MSCWDWWPTPPRDEDEWQDSDDGDMPWAPHSPDDPEDWKPRDWTGTPEERMHRDKAEEDGDA